MEWKWIWYLNNIIYTSINGEDFVKEYNNKDKLIFERKYINRERNGKGNEYG